jgi:hypothetical protein
LLTKSHHTYIAQATRYPATADGDITGHCTEAFVCGCENGSTANFMEDP